MEKIGSGMEKIRIQDKHPGSATMPQGKIKLGAKKRIDPNGCRYSMGSYLTSGVVAVLCCEVERGGTQPVRGEGRTARHEAAHSLRVAVPRSRQQLLPQLHQRGLIVKKKFPSLETHANKTPKFHN